MYMLNIWRIAEILQNLCMIYYVFTLYIHGMYNGIAGSSENKGLNMTDGLNG